MTGRVPDGLILEGRWRIEHEIALGGMSTVHAATDLLDKRTVVVKVLLEEAKGVPDLMARFRRERRILGAMTSVHVPRLVGDGRMGDGTPFLVMEYLTGSTLADLFDSWGTLPCAAAASYIVQACEALAEAHAMGIVHRDLKPANLFITTGDSGFALVKVLDFGISKSALAAPEGRDSQPTLTRATDVFGSPQYMSPEQLVASRQVDHAGDIWSLGVLLHQMVTGSLPFQGNTVPAVRAAVMTTKPTPAREVRPEVPEPLEAIILKCLEKFVEDRFGSVGDLAKALLPFAQPREPAEADLVRIQAYGPPARPPMHSDPAAAMDAVDVWNPDPAAQRALPAAPVPSDRREKLAILFGPFPKVHAPEPYVPAKVLRARGRRRVIRTLLATAAGGFAAGVSIGIMLARLLYW